MVQTATNTFYNREQEREPKVQGREKRKEFSEAMAGDMLGAYCPASGPLPSCQPHQRGSELGAVKFQASEGQI